MKIAVVVAVASLGGLALGVLAASIANDDDAPSADDSDDPGAVTLNSSSDFGDAVATCAPGSEHAQILDDGDGLSLEGKSDSIVNDGLEAAELDCILVALDTPETVVHRMGQTRALDGTQTGEWDDFAASWTYHPDAGLTVIIERTR